MARPIKDGVDYFPMDVVLDDKIKLIEAEFGLQGFAVIVKLWQKIYGQFGYYCEWTREVALLFSRDCNLGYNVVSEIVSAAIKWGLFDRGMFDKYSILTSEGIQSRYFEAVSRRKEIKVKKQYLIIKVTQNLNDVNNNSVNVNNNPRNVDDNTQSKLKESKVNKSKVNQTIINEFQELLKSEISLVTFNAWLNDLEIIDFDEKDMVTLKTLNRFKAMTILSNYKTLVSNCLTKAFKKQVQFKVEWIHD